MQSFRAALQLAPNLAILHANLGRALYRQGSFQESLDACQRSLELDPNQPRVSQQLEACKLALATADQHREQTSG